MRAGALRAVMCRGEQHIRRDGTTIWWRMPMVVPIVNGEWLETRKVFHVSPFFPVSGHYRFRFDRRGDQHAVAIDYFDGGQLRLRTRVSGRATPMGIAVAWRALSAYPLMTLGVIARIHVQAFHLWRARIPFFRKPAPPVQDMTR
jgi:DUF1365 family protein